MKHAKALALVCGLGLGLPGVSSAQQPPPGPAPTTPTSPATPTAPTPAAPTPPAPTPVAKLPDPVLPGVADNTPPAALTAVNLKSFTVRAAERLAILDLRGATGPRPGDFAIAAALMEIPQNLNPKDADLVRRRAEAAWNAGDDAQLIALTRRVVELDPDDLVAQLRVLTAGLGRLQSVDERLRAYDAMLGPKGAALDPTIRSRLAVDCAMLRREQGDEAGFVARLKDAIRLDGTNKDAALLAFNLFTQRSNDPRGRAEMLANLLYTDPLDPKVHRALRDEFAGVGAVEAARRFHETELRIVRAAGVPDPEGTGIANFVLLWLVEGPRKCADGLNLQLEARRSEVRTAADRDPSKVKENIMQTVQDVRLETDFEQVRAMAAFAAGDEEMLKASLTDLSVTVAARVKALSDVTTRPIGMTADEATERSIEVVIELQILRFVLRHDVDLALGATDEMFQHLPEGDARRADLEGWRRLASNDVPGAAERFGLVQNKTFWTQLGLAAVLEAKGETAAASRAYGDLARSSPLHLLGAFARWKMQQLGADPAVVKLAAEMESYAGTIPEWIDHICETPRLTQDLSVDLSGSNVGALDPVIATIRIKNVSPIPLGLGSGRTLNSRLFFGPNLEIGTRTRNDNAAGEIVDIDRRFRLMPNESLDVQVWPEMGLVGWLSELGASSPARLRWRVFQGFESGARGEKQAGPGCLEAATPTTLRDALPEARLPAAKLVKAIAAAKDDEVPGVLVAARSKLMGGVPGGTPDPDSQAIVDALVAAYPGWSSLARLAAVCVLPPVSVCPALAPFDEAARKDADGSVMAVVAATRIAKADDPWLVAAAGSADARLALIAGKHIERLKGGGRTYAAMGTQAMPRPKPPGLESAPGATPATAPTK